MSGVVFRALPAWPYPPSRKRPDTFRTPWGASLDRLAEEVAAIKGRDAAIGVVCDPSAITWSGALRAGGRTQMRHAGVEVSFEVPAGSGWRRLTFHTDAYPTVHANLHAIALGMEALRAVDRYGITTGTEQYAGFAALPAGDTPEELGRRLVEKHGGIAAALKASHPDHGGTVAEFAAVQAHRERVGDR